MGPGLNSLKCTIWQMCHWSVDKKRNSMTPWCPRNSSGGPICLSLQYSPRNRSKIHLFSPWWTSATPPKMTPVAQAEMAKGMEKCQHITTVLPKSLDPNHRGQAHRDAPPYCRTNIYVYMHTQQLSTVHIYLSTQS